jgi:hypothetical protein
MTAIPESLRRVLANLPKQAKPVFTPPPQREKPGDVTTILRDGTVYRTKPDGRVRYLPSVPPIS